MDIPTSYDEAFNGGVITDTDNIINKMYDSGTYYYYYQAATSEGTHSSKISFENTTVFKCDSTYQINYTCNGEEA